MSASDVIADISRPLNFGHGEILQRLKTLDSSVLLIVVGGGANIAFVATGIASAYPVPVFIAALGAALLLAVQFVLQHKVWSSGIALGCVCLTLYGVAASFNILLAAAGLTADVNSAELGRAAFQSSVAPELAAMQATADGFARLATAARQIANYSANEADLEWHDGKTCAGTSAAGTGDYFRLRRDDRIFFTNRAATIEALANSTNRDLGVIRAAIASYDPAHHEATSNTIEGALASARQAALDPRVSAMTSVELPARLEQIDAGRRDTVSGHVVVCPDDSLKRAIGAVLAQKMPRPPSAIDAVPPPTHATATLALFDMVGRRLSGQEVDFSPYRLGFYASWIPDALMLAGLALHRNSIRRRRGLSFQLAASFGCIGGWK